MEELSRYLEGWSCSRSFVPDGHQEQDRDLSVMPNAHLDEFQQRFLVWSVYRHLEQTTIGLDFISTMLMISKDNEAALGMLIPPLLLSGIDGGLQERAVQEALGAAGDATYGANRRIAGDAAAALNQLKAQRNKPI
jgi:hypothetical protein